MEQDAALDRRKPMEQARWAYFGSRGHFSHCSGARAILAGGEDVVEELAERGERVGRARAETLVELEHGRGDGFGPLAGMGEGVGHLADEGAGDVFVEVVAAGEAVEDEVAGHGRALELALGGEGDAGFQQGLGDACGQRSFVAVAEAVDEVGVGGERFRVAAGLGQGLGAAVEFVGGVFGGAELVVVGGVVGVHRGKSYDAAGGRVRAVGLSVNHYMLGVSDGELSEILRKPASVRELIEQRRERCTDLSTDGLAIMALTSPKVDDILDFLEDLVGPTEWSGHVGRRVEVDGVVEREVTVGYGCVRYYRHAFVMEVARRLRPITVGQFAARCDLDWLEAEHVYPLGWRDAHRKPMLIEAYARYRQCIMHAAIYGRHLLVWTA